MPDRQRPPSKRTPAASRPEPRPEQALRRQLHAHGLRFARGQRDLPGRPDIVLPRRRAVVFVHGCFWHGHGCALDRAAATFKAGAWARKIAVNQAQFDRDRSALRSDGWLVETVWECQIDDRKVIDRLAARLLRR